MEKQSNFCTQYKIICLILFVAVLSLCFSCSNTVPSISSQSTILIFDYSNTNHATQRLSVFVEPSSDIAHIQEITVQNSVSGLQWKISEPDFITEAKTNGKTWAGSAQLLTQETVDFPQGEYELKIIDYNGKSINSFFVIRYPTILRKTNVNNIQKNGFENENPRKYVIIYAAHEHVLFFGLSTESLLKPEEIKKKYTNAAAFQEYWESTKNSYGVLFPLKKIL